MRPKLGLRKSKKKPIFSRGFRGAVTPTPKKIIGVGSFAAAGAMYYTGAKSHTREKKSLESQKHDLVLKAQAKALSEIQTHTVKIDKEVSEATVRLMQPVIGKLQVLDDRAKSKYSELGYTPPEKFNVDAIFGDSRIGAFFLKFPKPRELEKYADNHPLVSKFYNDISNAVLKETDAVRVVNNEANRQIDQFTASKNAESAGYKIGHEAMVLIEQKKGVNPWPKTAKDVGVTGAISGAIIGVLAGVTALVHRRKKKRLARLQQRERADKKASLQASTNSGEALPETYVASPIRLSPTTTRQKGPQYQKREHHPKTRGVKNKPQPTWTKRNRN